MDLKETKTDVITLDALRQMFRSPRAREDYIKSCVREFIAALPETMENVFHNPPAGTKAHAVIEAVRHTHEIALTELDEAFKGEETRVAKERDSVVRELSDTLDGPNFDPDFKEPTP